MQRYFTLQLFECFDIPIDDLWAEIDVPDGMRMRRRMHSFFCRHSILRITTAFSPTPLSAHSFERGACKRGLATKEWSSLQ